MSVAHKVLERVAELKGDVISGKHPDHHHAPLRGDPPKKKSDELLLHMLIAIISVTLLIWFTLGLRESGVVALAITP